jgi:hypothetical protein
MATVLVGTNTNPQSSSVVPGVPQGQRLTPVKLDNAAGGDITVVAGVSGQTVRVFRILLMASAATNITFKDGATALTGAIDLAAAGSGMILDFSGEPWFVTSAGNAFVINSSNAVQVSGKIDYIQS